MHQLAFETTGKTGSLAIMEDENVLWSRSAGTEQRTAAEFAVCLQDALKWAEDHSRPLDYLSVAVGPGSFTGLRVAITTAKSLAYALSLPIIPVGSLAGIAATAMREKHSGVLVGLNAYRQQVFVAEFAQTDFLSAEKIQACVHRAEVKQRGEWSRLLEQAAEQENLIVTGDDAIFSAKQMEQNVTREIVDAVGVGRLASRLAAASIPNEQALSGERALSEEQAQSGEQLAPPYCDPFSLVANYLKPSAAEEKAAAH